MANVKTDGLPPEMQARIAQIIEGAKASQVGVGAPQAPVVNSPAPPPAPVQRTPSLIEHTIALRQEVDALRQQTAALAQVTDAVGQAVGQIYNAFFQEQQAATYSSTFQTQGEQVGEDDY